MSAERDAPPWTGMNPGSDPARWSGGAPLIDGTWNDDADPWLYGDGGPIDGEDVRRDQA